MIKGPNMTDCCLSPPSHTGVGRTIWRLIGNWRARSNSARTIDPAALSDHMQRDLGFRDGRSLPHEARRVADLSTWR